MSKHSEAIARSVLRVFRQQQQSGGERFGNWTGRMREALAKPLLEGYVAALKRFGVRDDDWAATVSLQQAAEAAVQLNDATTDMLERGRDYREVFSSDRAALVGVDQWDKAYGACQVRAAQTKKQKLRWVAKGPNICKACKKLAGKVRNPGKAFAIVEGVPIFHPPLHIHCYCELEPAT
jgi:hypothetical protein